MVVKIARGGCWNSHGRVQLPPAAAGACASGRPAGAGGSPTGLRDCVLGCYYTTTGQESMQH